MLFTLWACHNPVDGPSQPFMQPVLTDAIACESDNLIAGGPVDEGLVVVIPLSAIESLLWVPKYDATAIRANGKTWYTRAKLDTVRAAIASGSAP